MWVCTVSDMPWNLYGVWMTIASILVDPIFDMLLPRGCCACSKPDEVLCSRCVRLFTGSYRRALPGSSMGAYACARYEPLVRHAILGWKDHGDQECDIPFARALAGLSLRIRITDVLMGRPLWVVPVPSTSRSIRRRGRWHMLSLARAYAAALRSQGIDARVCAALTMHGVGGKAVETTGRGQRFGRVGGVRVKHPQTVRGLYVVLIDDIVTTGSTMHSCTRVLVDAGAKVITYVSLAQVDR